jgi:membrane protein DedA with SNARE-associated domain
VVVAARFVTGFRMFAGPLAGPCGIRPLTFMAANLVRAVLFVPWALALGYVVGRVLDAVGPPARTRPGVLRWWVPLSVVIALVLVVAIALALARWRRRPGGSASTP